LAAGVAVNDWPKGRVLVLWFHVWFCVCVLWFHKSGG
jgi:hypothetical protein